MSEKPRKSSSQKGNPKKATGKNSTYLTASGNWPIRLVFAFLAAAICFPLLPRLQFGAEFHTSYRIIIPMLSFFLLLWGTSGYFQKRKKWISTLLVISFFIQLLANLVLQFHWIDPNPFLETVAAAFILPTGILLACLLSIPDEIIEEKSATTGFLKAFSTPKVWIPAIVVIAIGCFMVFYRLGYYDFWEDEGMVINAAMGLRDEGLSYLEEGYDRAWFHSWLVSQSISLFGTSEWSARFPSAVFGLLFILVSYYVFYKLFHKPWLAILIPLVCLLTDEFLILFRYTRMYALLIPVFVLGIYLSFLFFIKESGKTLAPRLKWDVLKFDIRYGLLALLVMALSFHIHALAAIGFLGAFFFLIYLWFTTGYTRYKVFLVISVAIALVGYVLGLAKVDYFRAIPAAIRRMMMEDQPEYAYYNFLFNNGLPANITIMALLGGVGMLFNNKLDKTKRQVLFYFYAVIVLDLLFMVYLLADPGRDYRYIVHIVPFVVCIELIVLYAMAKQISMKWFTPIFLVLPVVCAGLAMLGEYKEVYVRHPWSPRYSEVYPDIKNKYREGEAIFYQNMKSYYLNPRSLAGDKALKMGRRKEFSLEQFKAALQAYPAAWVVFDTHKAYHIDPAIMQYLQKRFQKFHGNGIDDTGVEVYYFAGQ